MHIKLTARGYLQEYANITKSMYFYDIISIATQGFSTMTVITPGGPCLTQTQIAIREQQQRLAKNTEMPNPALQNPGAVDPQSRDKISAVGKTEGAKQNPVSYGSGGNMLDIIV